MKLDRATMVGVLASGLVLVVACSSSDGGTSGTSGTSGATSGGTSGATSGGTSGATSGGTSGTSGTDSGTSGTSGTSGSSGDAGQDAAEAGGGLKANGATCAVDGDCTSGHCLSQGGGGGVSVGSFCTIPCTPPGGLGAAACTDTTIYSGKCSGQGFCQHK